MAGFFYVAEILVFRCEKQNNPKMKPLNFDQRLRLIHNFTAK